jgi:Concanavalin A-like lectin/glucanases superfamily
MFNQHPITSLFLMAITFFSLTSSTVTSSQTCVPPPTNLVSWWPGDGNADDSVGANDGTLQNGATFGLGMVDPAFSLDGVDDYVRFGDIFDGLNGGFTLDVWIRTTSIAGNKAIIAKYWTTGGSWVIRTNENDPRKVDFTVCSPSCESLADAVQLISTSNVNDGAWHFIAATFDGTTQQLYVDGGLEAAGINTSPAWIDNHHFCIGSFCDPSGNSFSTFSGLIDEAESMTVPSVLQKFNRSTMPVARGNAKPLL